MSCCGWVHHYYCGNIQNQLCAAGNIWQAETVVTWGLNRTVPVPAAQRVECCAPLLSPICHDWRSCCHLSHQPKLHSWRTPCLLVNSHLQARLASSQSSSQTRPEETYKQEWRFKLNRKLSPETNERSPLFKTHLKFSGLSDNIVVWRVVFVAVGKN